MHSYKFILLLLCFSKVVVSPKFKEVIKKKVSLKNYYSKSRSTILILVNGYDKLLIPIIILYKNKIIWS
jgi:hypothetical protein